MKLINWYKLNSLWLKPKANLLESIYMDEDIIESSHGGASDRTMSRMLKSAWSAGTPDYSIVQGLKCEDPKPGLAIRASPSALSEESSAIGETRIVHYTVSLTK